MSVVPGSGTGDLAGLHGEGGFKGEIWKRVARNAGLSGLNETVANWNQRELQLALKLNF